ncbi:hypothetical protein BCR34DRAFT_609750 [Clohesyomyces aquaticus]|uniref:Uncharacterized protein n=1 Tax=Clohesyomyces aquaticus TaxID=1231657 RepID=A0A1Y2AAU0_9PLEO|nr:hypothetical protein BCR34DRAFT_609750 [Clohesyomyces aquaticus]
MPIPCISVYQPLQGFPLSSPLLSSQRHLLCHIPSALQFPSTPNIRRCLPRSAMRLLSHVLGLKNKRKKKENSGDDKNMSPDPVTGKREGKVEEVSAVGGNGISTLNPEANMFVPKGNSATSAAKEIGGTQVEEENEDEFYQSVNWDLDRVPVGPWEEYTAERKRKLKCGLREGAEV